MLRNDSSWTNDTPNNCTDALCGDGFFSHQEQWDDGNNNNGDGWSKTWEIEQGFTWKGWHNSSWTSTWGDGIKSSDENWEDGNIFDDDGCSSTWEIEQDYECNGWNTSNKNDTWEIVCGNGILNSKFNPLEYCDDNNTVNNDGCNSNCKVETGYDWIYDTISKWTPVWGDKIKIEEKEEWEDGNTNNNDGWDSECKVEHGYKWEFKTVSEWKPIWGDGELIGNEEWDDGNENRYKIIFLF